MAVFFFKGALSLYLLGTLGYILFIVFQIKPMARIAYGLLLLGFIAHTVTNGLWTIQNRLFPGS